MSSTRTCRIKGCETVHKTTLYCCRDHWYQLPKPMRDEVWSAFRRRGVLSVEYLQAAENAKAFLEDRDARDIEAELEAL